MCRFYYPDGTSMEGKGTKEARDAFVDFYSKMYFYLYRDIRREARIEEILASDFLGEDEIREILQWKTGGKYKDGVINIPRSKYSICVNEVYEAVGGRKEKCDSEEEHIGLLKRVINCRGIGSVYALTILYFVTKGNCPIYDKYADLALRAIVAKPSQFPSVLAYEELSSNVEKAYERYKEYEGLLQDVFGKEAYRKSRDIDRAVWTYGHLFNNTEANKERG